MNPLFIIPLAYLLGSIPFGMLIVKVAGGRDIREVGSGNIGAANVTRNAGIIAGIFTLFLDAAKGYFSVWLAGHVTGGSARWMMAAAVAAVAGHMFPVWLGLHGGKGVATSLGVFLPICREAVILAVVLWIIVVAFWRYSSLGSIVAAAAMPVLIYVLYAPTHAPPTYVTVWTIAISLLVLAKHYANLERLMAGTEAKLGSRRRPPSS